MGTARAISRRNPELRSRRSKEGRNGRRRRAEVHPVINSLAQKIRKRVNRVVTLVARKVKATDKSPSRTLQMDLSHRISKVLAAMIYRIV